MSFLPIVGRELRVASRGRFNYYSRVSAAILALLIFAALQTLAMATGGIVFRAGSVQFAVLKWLSFAYACSAGVFLTSDTLSEEKREGTLGLLFLTDLRGYDVVLGKLLSHSLRAFYGLLAAFPILGLTMLAGGVTGGEFWRSMLVICNTLFLSLSLCLMVSVFSRDSTRAMSGAFLVSVLLFAGPMMVDSIIAESKQLAFTPKLSYASPAWLFGAAGAYYLKGYWMGLGLQHALAWVCLLVASLRAPRTWQEKSGAASAARLTFLHRWRFGGAKSRSGFRRRAMGRSPIIWLATRDRWVSRLLLVLTPAVAVLMMIGWYFYYLDYSTPLVFLAGFQQLFVLTLTLWLVLQACRAFADSIRSGALEIVLVTPLGPERIVRDHWTALWRTYLFPVLLVVFLQVSSGILQFAQMRQSLTAPGAAASAPLMSNYDVFILVSTVVGVVTLVAGLAALGWFGMWMGLTNRKTSIAVLKTICFVSVLPALALGFANVLITVLVAFGGFQFIWLASLVYGALHLAKDFFFIFWSRKRLFADFRETVALAGQTRWVRRLAPPVLQPVPPSPPAVPAA